MTDDDADEFGAGVLRPCLPDGDGDGDGPATLDPDVARLHHRLRVELAAHLLTSVPDGWEVTAGCCWQPTRAKSTLHPDVVVHRPLTRDGGLPAPPVLCVDIAAGPADNRSGLAYARLGVDHHWHIDSHDGTLKVSVRVDDVYRRCEIFSTRDLATSDAFRTPAWVDFGVGIALLDGLLLQH